MPAGRPSKYDPAYCDAIIDYMATGKSKTAFAGSIRVARDTIYEWAATHKEFSDAVKVAEAARVNVLEDDLLAAESGPKVTSRIFALKNAAPDEWKDKTEQDVNVKTVVENWRDRAPDQPTE